jgi:Short C-terminal domain
MHGKLLLIAVAVASYHIRSFAPVYPDWGDRWIDETERSSQQAQQAREELRRVVDFSAADEIEKLDRLKKSGSITDQEFARLRAKLVA